MECRLRAASRAIWSILGSVGGDDGDGDGDGDDDAVTAGSVVAQEDGFVSVDVIRSRMEACLRYRSACSRIMRGMI